MAVIVIKDFNLDFIGIGAQKAGTTWLANHLAKHPSICMSEPKEINYFNEKGSFARSYANKNHAKPFSWYKKHFAHCKKGQLRGEFSTSYLYDRKAPVLIQKHFPKIKLIVCLRNPIDRAYSQYWMLKNYLKLESRTFERAIEEEHEYVWRGMYYKQLKHFLKYFKKEQILVVMFDDIKKRPELTLKRVFKFLHISENIAGKVSLEKSNPSKKVKFGSITAAMGLVSKTLVNLRLSFLLRMLKYIGVKKIIMKLNTSEFKYDGMDAEVRKELRLKFKKDIKNLEKLLDRDLSHWR